MQIRLRCYNCSTPFAIKPDQVLSALDQVHQEGHKHYNAVCPRCGKNNRISKKQLQQSAPNWSAPKTKAKAGEKKKN